MQQALEALAPAQAALDALQYIRCHPKRHDLDREWLTKADHIINYWGDVRAAQKVIQAQQALRTALEQPEQEPVACVIDGDLYFHHEIDWEDLAYRGHGVELLYTTPPQRQWDKPSASFNEWWNGDYDDSANPFEKDSAAYWAWAGWQAAQRQWVGLEAEDLAQIESDEFWQTGNHMAIAMAVEAKLKEKNT
jgi:hypothetical protein